MHSESFGNGTRATATDSRAPIAPIAATGGSPVGTAVSSATTSHDVGVVTIDRMPRQATVAAQVLRALAERGIHIDSLTAGRSHTREQLVITVPAAQAPLVLDIATNVAGRFGVGPVSLDHSWTEITIAVRGERTAGVVMAELYELLELHRIEARTVTANGSSVSCVVRNDSLPALIGLAEHT